MTDKTRKASAQVAAVEVEAPASAATDGLSMRDHLAMHAPEPPAYWTNRYIQQSGMTAVSTEAFAAWAYEYADAMLKERAK